jgi:hypothetical protein
VGWDSLDPDLVGRSLKLGTGSDLALLGANFSVKNFLIVKDLSSIQCALFPSNSNGYIYFEWVNHQS